VRELAVDWPPLAVNEGAITLGYGRAWFRPEGLAVPHRGAPDDVLPWGEVREPDERGTGWALVVEGGGHGVLSLVVDVRSGPPYDGPHRHHVGGAAPGDDAAVHAATALVSYLRDEPAARAGLGVPLTVSTLLRALRRQDLGRPKGLPREPWMGDGHDLHHAVLRGLRDAWPRWYALRGVAGDPPPDLATAVAAVRRRLRPGLAGRFDDGEIAERVAPYLAVEPWPFDVLVPD
jgi:hypothetical protein